MIVCHVYRDSDIGGGGERERERERERGKPLRQIDRQTEVQESEVLCRR